MGCDTAANEVPSTAAPSALETRSFVVASLLAPKGPYTLGGLARLAQNAAGREAWGEPGADVAASEDGERLTAHGSRAAVDAIEEFVGALRDRVLAARPEARFSDAEIARRLGSARVSVSMEERVWDDVFRTLEIQSGIDVRRDPRLAETTANSKVRNLRITDLPMSFALNWIASEGPWEYYVWTVQGGALVLTRPDLVDWRSVQSLVRVARLDTCTRSLVAVGIEALGPARERPCLGRIEVEPVEGVLELGGPLVEEAIVPFGTAEDLWQRAFARIAEARSRDGSTDDVVCPGRREMLLAPSPERESAVAEFLRGLRSLTRPDTAPQPGRAEVTPNPGEAENARGGTPAEQSR